MTQLTPQHPGQPPAPEQAGRVQSQGSMLRRVIGELLLYWSARVSLAWVAVLVLCAVFAPLIANSHPLLMLTAEADPGERLTILSRFEPGSWSSPLLRHLTVADVLLPLVLLAVGVTVLWRGGVTGGRRLLALLAFIGLVVVLGLWRQHVAPFIVSGHEMWLRDLRDWLEGVERMAGVPPRAPVGPFVWWLLLWMGLVMMLAGTALAVAGVVMNLAPRLVDRRSSLAWLLPSVVVAVALWVVLLTLLPGAMEQWPGAWTAGVAVWVVGLVGGAAALAWAIVTRRAASYRPLGMLAVVAGVLVGGWMVHAPVSPPRITTFEQYRAAVEAGEIERVWYTPIPYSPDDRMRDQRDMRFQPPSRDHLLGTTQFSADLSSNMVHGTRIALSVGFIATSIAIVIGVIIGGIMGYFSGIPDLLGMRLVEMFSAIPTLFLLLAFVAAFGANLYIIMIIIGLTSWVSYAVFIRAEFLRLREQEFIQAAQALGLPLWSILFRHLLPNGIAPVLVAASFGVASAIGFEATLSFLGVGLDTEASWGLLLEQALRGGAFNWWIAVTPGLAIFLTVFAYILIGEALRDAIDPKTQKSRQ
ncbi:MAG: ABC transporter permease [Phycisphaeraceae bacterium]